MKKTEQYLTYTAKDGREIRFPIAVIEGAKDGPHAVITAGIHGGEYPPIAAAIEFYKKCDPADVSGTITIVTVSNLPAFEGRSVFVTPVDGKNPNRLFPGDPEGSYTANMVYHLFKDVISKADLHMDLHCGDIIESLVPFAEFPTGIDEKTDRGSREIAYYYGLPHCIAIQSDLSKPYAGLNYENSARYGIPSALVEIGEHGKLDREAVDGHLRGICNVLRHFGVLAGEAFEPQNTEFFKGFAELNAPCKGIFYCDIVPGDTVSKGQKVGRMEDYFGNHLCDVISPADGKVMYITDNPAMFEDNFIGDIAFK